MYIFALHFRGSAIPSMHHAKPHTTGRRFFFHFPGTMYPWESAFTGCPVCPEEVYSNYEIHVNGDIGFAVEQYWMVTRDRAWLTDVGIPMISGIAEFWASRVKYDDAANDYVINSVMCPDEYHSNVNNSAFTNAVAKRNLEFASKVIILA